MTVMSVLLFPSKLAMSQSTEVSESLRIRDQVLDTDGRTLTPLDFFIPPDLGSVNSVGIIIDDIHRRVPFVSDVLDNPLFSVRCGIFFQQVTRKE